MIKLALLAATVAVADPSLPARLPPVDQCSADPSFAAFRGRLATAVGRHDSQALLELVDGEILVSFGMGGDGKQAFIEAWALNRPGQSKLWAELETLLRLGCTKGEGDSYVMPSFFDQASEADALETYLAIVPGSLLRAQPRQDAASVATLDWDVLTLDQVSDDQQWYGVRLADGRKGYVRHEEARNLIDYRMVISRRGGTLRISALVAGD